MYCVIVGGGMVGEYLARTLLAEGDQVALIEGDPQVATHLSETLEGPVLVIQMRWVRGCAPGGCGRSSCRHLRCYHRSRRR